jgi:hypothetical protein
MSVMTAMSTSPSRKTTLPARPDQADALRRISIDLTAALGRRVTLAEALDHLLAVRAAWLASQVRSTP